MVCRPEWSAKPDCKFDKQQSSAAQQERAPYVVFAKLCNCFLKRFACVHPGQGNIAIRCVGLTRCACLQLEQQRIDVCAGRKLLTERLLRMLLTRVLCSCCMPAHSLNVEPGSAVA